MDKLDVWFATLVLQVHRPFSLPYAYDSACALAAFQFAGVLETILEADGGAEQLWINVARSLAPA